nr:unnamed protein product [Callosobruchus chinensis]
MSQYNNIVNDNGRVLDLVMSNVNIDVCRVSSPLIKEDTYHPALYIAIDGSYVKDKQFKLSNSSRYNFKKANFMSLYQELLYADWDFLETEADVNILVDNFYNRLYNIFDEHVPITKQYSHKYPVWYTDDMIKLVKEKARWHRKFQRTKNMNYYQEFSRLRNVFKQKVKEAYTLYIQKIQDEIKLEPKLLWSFIHNKNNTSRIPSIMSDGEVFHTDPESIVNAFADFFKSMFDLPENPTQSNENAILYFCNPIEISNEQITENEILIAAKKIKNKLTSGPDQIPSFLVKDCISTLVKPLKIIFNLILKNSIFPDTWKIAKVCPIHKSQDRDLISNYRPISILNNFAKVLEIILYNRIYLGATNCISIDQHGFMKSRSTLTNLAVFSQYLCEHLDNGGQVDAIYTDFTKAFDKVNHKELLNKLSCLGFDNRYIMLLKSYLSNREQYVHYNGYLSYRSMAVRGVPQGSNLGPLLFLLYVNDLCGTLKCRKLMFADDIKLFATIESNEDCVMLQQQLSVLRDWCERFKLQLNISKCKVLSFSRKKNILVFPYEIGGMTLVRTDHIKDLGIYFDKQLSFNDNISHTVASAFSMYGFITRNCKSFDIDVLLLLYYSLIRSKLEYCSMIWSPIYDVYKQTVDQV